MGKKSKATTGFSGRTIGNMIKRSTGAPIKSAPQPKKGKK